MNYEVAGQGKTVVFLHGMTGSNQDWVNQVCLLTPNYRVVAPDMRGHGKSAAPLEEEKYSIPIFVEEDLLDAVGKVVPTTAPDNAEEIIDDFRDFIDSIKPEDFQG